MARQIQGIDDDLKAYIESQPMFVVATAPLSPHGHVNCSPKSNDGSLLVLGPRKIAFRDLTGSGIETVSHLRENGRIVVMVCSFQGPPRIVRLHGTGTVITASDPRFAAAREHFSVNQGTRAVIQVEVERISTSCGHGVPLMSFEGHRPNMDRWAETKGADGLARYRLDKNASGVDGLPGWGPADEGPLLPEAP